MKNQYVGDIGDFGKYSLLRAFSDAGVKVGVNWYLTENDGSNDGKFTDYLHKENMRRYNPEIFDALKKIADKPDKSIKDISKSNVIPEAVFYTELLKVKGAPADREYDRSRWFEESMNKMADTELVFLDPDNGLLESNDAGKLGADKYVLPDEVERYFMRGHNVVYYCHKGRRTYDLWQSYKSIMFERIPEAKPAILTYHKGSQRSYVFLIHEKDFVRYRKIIDGFLHQWYKIFSEEFTSKGNVSEEAVGDSFILAKSDGTVITIQKRADGRVQTCSSKKPGEIVIRTIDHFCNILGY